jgi:zinc transport system substrate-binding protein
MIVMSLRRALLAVLLVPLATGCSALGGERSGKPQVVASFYPLQYIAQRVAGRHADVVELTQPGREPHDLELTVRQTAELVDADVVVYERGFQPAVDDVVDQSSPARVVDAAETADLTGDDPHFWLDPTRLAAVATAVERQLAATDPAHRRAYAAGLRALRADLASLDASYRRGLRRCAVTTLVVSHDAFGYLGRRYGLDVVGISGLSPDAEPSPAHLRELQDLVRADGVTTVFSERLASREFAESLAGDLGIHAAVLDPVEGLTDATADDDYLSLMRRNLSTLRKAGGCA